MELRKILGFAVGPVATAALGAAIVPITAWVFSPEDLGRLNVFQTTLSFALLLSTLGLDRTYLREYHVAADRDRLLRSCALPGFILLTLVVMVCLPFSRELSGWLYARPDAHLFVLTAVAFYFSYVSRFLSLILRMQERGLAYSASQAMPKLLSLLLILAVSVSGWERSFTLLQAILLTSMLAVLIIHAVNTREQWVQALRSRISPTEFRPLVSYGLPLALSGLAYWGMSATSTLALRTLSTLDELAIFSVVTSVAGIAVIFQMIFATIWAPTVYKWAAQGADMKIVDDVARYALLIVCLIFSAVGLFSWVLDYILPPHYASVKYLAACAIAPPLLYTLSEVTNVGIGISRRTGWTVWITLAALVTNVGMSWLLVPRHGAAGAVVANAVGFGMFFILRTEVSAALWRQFPRARMYSFLLGIIGLAVGLVVFRNSLEASYPLVWLVPLGVVALAFRSELVGLSRLARQRVARAHGL